MTTTSTGAHEASAGALTRGGALVGIAVIGIALAVLPLAFNRLDRTPKVR
jgi:hypothetical protein